MLIVLCILYYFLEDSLCTRRKEAAESANLQYMEIPVNLSYLLARVVKFLK